MLHALDEVSIRWIKTYVVFGPRVSFEIRLGVDADRQHGYSVECDGFSVATGYGVCEESVSQQTRHRCEALAELVGKAVKGKQTMYLTMDDICGLEVFGSCFA